MKKMIIGVCAIAFAAVAQAAAINWSVNYESWKMQDGTDPATGTQMWLVDYAKADAIATAVEGLDFSGNWQAALGAIDGVYATATSTASAMLTETLVSNSALIDIEDGGPYYQLSTLIVDTTSDKGPYYMISNGTEESWATDNGDNYDTANFTSTMFTEGTGWQAVPEPTSGLLMLIGMAGFALRRRRA